MTSDLDIWLAGSFWHWVKFEGQGHGSEFTVTQWNEVGWPTNESGKRTV